MSRSAIVLTIAALGYLALGALGFAFMHLMLPARPEVGWEAIMIAALVFGPLGALLGATAAHVMRRRGSGRDRLRSARGMAK